MGPDRTQRGGQNHLKFYMFIKAGLLSPNMASTLISDDHLINYFTDFFTIRTGNSQTTREKVKIDLVFLVLRLQKMMNLSDFFCKSQIILLINVPDSQIFKISTPRGVNSPIPRTTPKFTKSHILCCEAR